METPSSACPISSGHLACLERLCVNSASRKGKKLATGIQTGIRRGSRGPGGPPPSLARVFRLLSHFRNLIIVTFCLSTILAMHLGSSPWERILGLAHGQEVKTPEGQYLVFDHFKASSADVLNQDLFSAVDGQQMLVVEGYGLWRFGLLMALCYLLCLTITRSLFKLQVKNFLKTGVRVDRRYFMLLAVMLGAGLGLIGIGNLGPAAFALAFLSVLITGSRRELNTSNFVMNLELLDIARCLWGGWLIAIALNYTGNWDFQVGAGGFGLLIGIVAVFLCGGTLATNLKNGNYDDRVKKASYLSFVLGHWESYAVMTVAAMAWRLGWEHLYGFFYVAGAYGIGRVLQTLLILRIIHVQRYQVVGTERGASVGRILTGVWFLLPAVLGPFIANHTEFAIAAWLFGLIFAVPSGRPWGSTSNYLVSPSEIMLFEHRPGGHVEFDIDIGLTPKQRAAVLFMSLPPEMSAQLFSELGPEEVQAITLEITQLPSIPPELRVAVINEFLNSSHGQGPYTPAPHTPARRAELATTDALESLTSKSPANVAGKIKDNYLTEPEPERKSRRKKKKHTCAECGDIFNHGIGLRKHQRQTGHKGGIIEEL